MQDTISFGPVDKIDSQNELKIDNMKFLLKYHKLTDSRRPYQGILGLAPRDDGSGPLVVE